MEQGPKLPIREAIEIGWQRTRENLRPLVFLGLLNLLLSIAQQSAVRTTPEQSSRPVLALALQVFQFAVWMIYVRWALALRDGRALEGITDASVLRGWLAFIVTALCYGAVVCFGLVLLLVPGVVWGLRYMFANTLVVDRGLEPMDALRESARLTRGVKAPLLGFALLCVLLNAVGGAFLGLGLILSLPVTFIAQAHLLRHLQARVHDEVAQAHAAAASPSPA